MRDFIVNARNANTEAASRDALVDPAAEEPYDWRDG